MAPRPSSSSSKAAGASSSSSSSQTIKSRPPPDEHARPPKEPVLGPETADGKPTATSPTAFDNNDGSQRDVKPGKPTVAIQRVQQITNHLDGKLLVIPGPIEVSDDVLLANAHPSMSHVSPDFVPVLGDCIRMLRKLLFAPDCQPVITAGSGTLGWDHVAANVSEPGDNVLVLNSGYFGDSFVECFQTYGVSVDQIKAPIGSKPSLEDVEKQLKAKKYKVLTFTHVDTSTGVLSDAKGLGELVKRVSPETILVLDGVCSVGSEEIRMQEWGIDVTLTASQKGLGCPPGLMVLAASPKAIKAWESRKVPPNSYFASWSKWVPVMKAYEAGTGAYFGTPPTNIIYALHQSLTNITTKSPSIEERFKMHIEASDRVKNFVKNDLGLEQLVADGIKDGAHGMTAVKFPQGIKAPDLLPKMVAKNVVVAAGLHKEVKETYFRIGHMGVTVTHDKQRGDIDHLLKSLKESLAEAGYKGGKQ